MCCFCMLFDIHSHVIPGIDDGSETLEKSIEILHGMERAGVKNLMLTPHYSVRRGYTPSKEKIISSYEILREECLKREIGIRLYLGCEIEYSSDIPLMLQSGKLLTLADTKYVLVEFAPYASFNDILSAVHGVIQVGYIPVIAHIERYRPMIKDIKNITCIKHFGALVQVNIDSVISGNFFMHRFIKKIIKGQLVDFIAGDVHSDLYTVSQLERCAKLIEDISAKDYADRIMLDNAKDIFTREGE